jgi:hypothetical protein
MNTCSALADLLRKVLASLLIAASTSARSVTSSRGGCRFAHRAPAGTRVPGDTEIRRNTRHHVRRWAYDDSFYPLLTSIFGPHRP